MTSISVITFSVCHTHIALSNKNMTNHIAITTQKRKLIIGENIKNKRIATENLNHGFSNFFSTSSITSVQTHLFIMSLSLTSSATKRILYVSSSSNSHSSPSSSATLSFSSSIRLIISSKEVVSSSIGLDPKSACSWLVLSHSIPISSPILFSLASSIRFSARSVASTPSNTGDPKNLTTSVTAL